MPTSNSPKLIALLKNIPLSLAIILFFVTVLRIPTFFEPYWYGDEGIYLVIGTALNRGALLYTDIVDHKTPLIYYFARVNSQLEFRFLLYVWMIISTTAFYFIAAHFTRSLKTVILATSIFALFTTVPWFEGNIANGELFVMGFVLVALWILTHTKYFSFFKQEMNLSKYSVSRYESVLLLISGMLLGLAILTKVPALFDAVAMFGISFFIVLRHWRKDFWHSFISILKPSLIIILGIIIPIIISILYYYSLGSGQDYLNFGLLYNFKYAGSWQLGFTNPLLAFFFTLPGKVTFLLVATALISFSSKYSKSTNQLLLFWFSLAFVASLLSNRPYPHYFLQAIPPLSLLVAIGLAKAWSAVKAVKTRHSSVITAFSSLLCLLLFIATLAIMHVGLYPTASYYKNFIAYATGSMTQEQYYQTFNYLMEENYRVASLLKSESPDKIFIWGTNPMLYALSDTRPVGRFTVAFHIEDLGVYEETMSNIKTEKPLYIVVMRDQQVALPGLNFFLNRYYIPVETTDHMIIWRKLNNKRV